MASARISPTANLLRKSRFFALPPTLSPPPTPPTSRIVFESDTATLPYPIRASVVTPGSSLTKGDWGLKRPLPAKSTSARSSRPVVRVIEQDSFEHVTDFESASDHVMTLEKFQELNIPISLLSKVNYSQGLPEHQSPFETHFDNTHASEGVNKPDAKQFRHKGPSLAGMTEEEFSAYLRSVQKKRGKYMDQIIARIREGIIMRRRKEAQDNGEDLEAINHEITHQEILECLKLVRNDPAALGPIIFEMLDLPSPPPVPAGQISHKYFEPPATRMPTIEYAMCGPPKTHPSAGLSYQRTHAALYNHPNYGPQAVQRPTEARILRPKGRFKGRISKAVAGVGGIVVDDLNAVSFAEKGNPAGLGQFDASIPGGGKYWVSPSRAYVDTDGRISLASFNANPTAKAAYGLEDYQKPNTTRVSEVTSGGSRTVSRLDQPRYGQFNKAHTAGARQPARRTEDISRNLMNKFNGS